MVPLWRRPTGTWSVQSNQVVQPVNANISAPQWSDASDESSRLFSNATSRLRNFTNPSTPRVLVYNSFDVGDTVTGAIGTITTTYLEV